MVFGTYSGGSSKGIYRADIDAATGALTNPQVAGETTSPSFVAIHPNGKLETKPWGFKEFAVLDPGGLCIHFAERL